jgi:hypothetical protein
VAADRYGRMLALTLVALFGADAASLHAARSLQPTVAQTERVELVVYEAPASAYSQLFRRDVVPGYQASPAAKRAPMRFLDIAEANLEAPELTAGPITMVPTVVLMRDGKEDGRITGYTGPENFFRLVNAMMGGNSD